MIGCSSVAGVEHRTVTHSQKRAKVEQKQERWPSIKRKKEENSEEKNHLRKHEVCTKKGHQILQPEKKKEEHEHGKAEPAAKWEDFRTNHSSSLQPKEAAGATALQCNCIFILPTAALLPKRGGNIGPHNSQGYLGQIQTL